MRRKTYQELIDSIREHKRLSVIADQTFSPIPEGFKLAAKEDQQRRFDIWWDSWIEPKLAELETRLGNRKAKR